MGLGFRVLRVAIVQVGEFVQFSLAVPFVVRRLFCSFDKGRRFWDFGDFKLKRWGCLAVVLFLLCSVFPLVASSWRCLSPFGIRRLFYSFDSGVRFSCFEGCNCISWGTCAVLWRSRL